MVKYEKEREDARRWEHITEYKREYIIDKREYIIQKREYTREKREAIR